MGFEILPIEDSDIDAIDPKYDIFELTSPQKWIPARFCARTAKMEGEQASDNPVDLSVEEFLDDLRYDELVQPCLDNVDFDGFTVGYSRVTYNGIIKPWHRVLHHALDPVALKKYFAWRPVNTVKKT